VIAKSEQWLYSFGHNSWALRPLETDAPLGFARNQDACENSNNNISQIASMLVD
jgi:predicted NAD/FAD-dependent oxidoreductase